MSADANPAEPTREDTAVVGGRIIAQIIDWVMIFLILIGFSFIGGFISGLLGDSGDSIESVMILLMMAAMFGYTFLLEGYWDGKTVGKHAMNIKVVREDGSKCTIAASFVRNLPAFVWFTALTYLVGFASMAITDKRQRVFDSLAGTVVVADNK